MFHLNAMFFILREESSRRKRQWFDINDSRISCIRDEDLQCQFSGKESAYMLFYRRRKLSVPKENPGEIYLSTRE